MLLKTNTRATELDNEINVSKSHIEETRHNDHNELQNRHLFKHQMAPI